MNSFDNLDVSNSSMDYVLKRNLSSKNTVAIIITGEDGLKKFCCIECPFRTGEKEKFELHLLVHNRGYRFLCEICGSGLKRREHFDRHTAEHEEYRPYICSECGKAFKRKEHLNIHFALHVGNKNQECSICKKTFYRKDHLQKHIQIHNKLFLKQNIFPLNDQDLEVKQEIMDDNGEDIEFEVQEQYDTESVLPSLDSTENSSLDGYMLQVGSEERPFVCLVCNKTYKRRDHLKKHGMTHIKKAKQCAECGKSFLKDDQLLEHMNTHVKFYANNTEDMTNLHSLLRDQSEFFSEDNSLLVPRTTRHKDETRPHECNVCNRRFKRRQHLKVHMNIHLRHKSKEKAVWCSFCNCIFETNEEFEDHICRMGSESNDEQPLEDDDEQPLSSIPTEAKKENKLPMEFVEVDMGSSDDVQFTVVRDERHLPVPQRVYVCKYCSKPFKRKDHYKIHLHIHTGIKSFFCPDCGKGFYRKDHMQKHMQVHTKAKPKPKRSVPDLYPINAVSNKNDIKPEITIHAPSNAKLRLPLQIKVPYQMVLSTDDGEQHAVTVNPEVDTPDFTLS